MVRTADGLDPDKITSNAIFYLLPAGMGLFCGAVLIVLSGISAISVGATLGFTLIGVGVGRLLFNKKQSQLDSFNAHWQQDENNA